MPQFIGNDLCVGTDSQGRKIIIPHHRRLQHTGIFGTTGCGKSRLLEHMLRSDLRAWPKTKCGMLLIDPHGSICQGILDWVAANRLFHLPIIPIDLSSQTNIVSYNVLRRRTCDPMVIVDNLVRAMAYVWGKSGTSETPLFERWATNILHRLYHEGRTLADARHLFSRDGAIMTDGIHDPLIKRDWVEAGKNWKGFETDAMSTLNRFRRFLLNPTLLAMFGQPTTSLDFGKALTEGHIILVSLSRTSGLMSAENGNLLATLLLADLWVAAAERGKGDNQKPFYCILDEFERFLSPSIAENLAEARGFSLGITTACQHPQQLLTSGENGRRLYHEVMENCRTKIIFRLSSEENLTPVATQLCMRGLDPYRVKYQHQQLTTVGHEVRYLDAYGRTSTSTVGGGKVESQTHTRNSSDTDTWNHTDSDNWTHAGAKSHGRAKGASENSNWNKTDGLGTTETTQASKSIGGNKTATNHASQTNTETLGISGRDLQKDEVNPDFKEHFDEDKLAQSWQVAKAGGTATTTAEGTHWQQGDASTLGQNKTSQQSEGGGHGSSSQDNESETTTDTCGGASADGIGGSHTEGESDAVTKGTIANWSKADGQSVVSSPHVIPVLKNQPAAPVFFSIDEQIAMQKSAVARLKDRTALILTADMNEPALIDTPTVNRPDIGRTIRSLTIDYFQQESGLSVDLTRAKEELKARDIDARSKPAGDTGAEPRHYGRKIPPKNPPAPH